MAWDDALTDETTPSTGVGTPLNAAWYLALVNGIKAYFPVSTANGGTGIATLPRRTIWLSAAGGWASTTDGASAAAITETANGGEFMGVSFAADATKYLNWMHVMPSNYNGGVVVATPVFLPVTSDASDHTIIFSVQGASFASTEAKNVAFGTAIDSSYTVAADQSANVIFGPTTGNITLGGTSAAGGELVLWRVHRDTADTYTGAVVLLGIRITYLTNATSDE